MQASHRKRLYARVIVSVLLAVSVVCFIWAYNAYSKYRESRQYAKEVREELATVLQREEELRAKIAYLETEEGVEAEIRNRFNVAKEGEEVIVIVDNEENNQMPIPEEKNFFEQMWDGFLGWFD